MAEEQTPYGPGVDAVGLPTGEEVSGATGEPTGLPAGFDIGSVFSQVKSWLVKNDDKIIQVVVPWLKKQLKGSGLEGDLPDTTSITKMLLPSQVARLSPAVKKLTKRDLLALVAWGVARKLPADLGLTAKDIQTIRDVFTSQLITTASLDEEPEAWSLSCCSCTPCCCAAAVTRPVRVAGS